MFLLFPLQSRFCQAEPPVQGSDTHTNTGILPAFSLSVFLTLFCPLSFVKSSSSVMRTTLQSRNSRSAITPMFEEGEQQISRIIRENFVVVEAGMVDIRENFVVVEAGMVDPPRRYDGGSAW